MPPHPRKHPSKTASSANVDFLYEYPHSLFGLTNREKDMDDALRITVAITSGHGSFIGLNTNNHLIVGTQHQRVNIGPLTQQRAREISEYLQRLAIHTPEK